ncbi:hypothetical protein [Ideonella sp. YS5]|uniref:hypothetical protein n=1 Tax=Ideonella sp. YS5 TaxID=3453714 RepID=UPI003EE89DA5
MDWTKVLPAVVGTLAFALSLYNLYRAVATEGDVRSLAYAQRKQEVLAAILNGEAAWLRVKVQAQDLRDDAEDSKATEAQIAVKQANFLVEQCNVALKLLEESREALATAGSKGKSSADLLAFIEEHAAAVAEYTNTGKIEAEAAAVLQPSRRLMKLILAAKSASKST